MTVAPFVLPYFLAMDADGNPLPGAKLYSFIGGTSTPKTTYSDPAGVTPNQNPVIADASGRMLVYLAVAEAYKLNLLDAANVQQALWPVDNIIMPDPGEVTPTSISASAIMTFNASGFSGQGSIAAPGVIPADTYVVEMRLSCTQNFSTANGLASLALSDGQSIRASGLGFLTSTVFAPIPWNVFYPTATTLTLLAEGGTFGPTGILQVTALGLRFP